VKNKGFHLVPPSNGNIEAILFSAYDEILGKTLIFKGDITLGIIFLHREF
jgi:hypothetical protein